MSCRDASRQRCFVSCLTHQEFKLLMSCRDATSSPVLTFQPNHSPIPALSNDIEHSMQTKRFPVYLYIYLVNF